MTGPARAFLWIAAAIALSVAAPASAEPAGSGARYVVKVHTGGATARPAPRPQRSAGVEIISTSGVLRSPRPANRPADFIRRALVKASAVRTQPAPGTVTGRKGSVCGIDAIKGETLSPIAGRIQGCGLDRPVRVTSVSGVALTQAAVMDCTTAEALNTWVQDGVLPTVGQFGGGVASLRVAAHYACRTRNNQKGARISEHGRGRAIDISAIVFENGSVLSVLKGWRDESRGPLLKSLHKAACGTFGTVLGPNSDRFHQDHFHFDTARYRSGPYCR